MEFGARDSHEHGPSSWSAARRLADTALLRTLERVTDIDDEGMHPAVHAFVEVLVKEGLTPEAVVIALKDTFGRAHFLNRFEPLVREQMRSAWVSECIDQYFASRATDDVSLRSAESVRQTRQLPRSDDESASQGQ
jgi:hypothetical protein